MRSEREREREREREIEREREQNTVLYEAIYWVSKRHEPLWITL